MLGMFDMCFLYSNFQLQMERKITGRKYKDNNALENFELWYLNPDINPAFGNFQSKMCILLLLFFQYILQITLLLGFENSKKESVRESCY